MPIGRRLSASSAAAGTPGGAVSCPRPPAGPALRSARRLARILLWLAALVVGIPALVIVIAPLLSTALALPLVLLAGLSVKAAQCVALGLLVAGAAIALGWPDPEIPIASPASPTQDGGPRPPASSFPAPAAVSHPASGASLPDAGGRPGQRVNGYGFTGGFTGGFTPS